MIFSAKTTINNKLRLLAPLLLLLCSVLLIHYFGDTSATEDSTKSTPILPSPNAIAKDTQPSSAISHQSQLTLNNPEVAMDAESGLLIAKLAVRIQLPTLTAPILGHVSITGKPQLAENTQQFFLTESTIVNVDLPNLPKDVQLQTNQALTQAVALFFQQHAAFAPLDNGTVQNSQLSVTF